MKQAVYNFLYGSIHGLIATTIVIWVVFFIESVAALLFSNADSSLMNIVFVLILYGPGFTIALGIFVGIPLGGLFGLLSPSGKITTLALVFAVVSGGLPMLFFGLYGETFIDGGSGMREEQYASLYNVILMLERILGGVIGGSLGGYYFHHRLLKLIGQT